MLAFSGASATFDARFFSPYGTLSQSAILQSSLNERFAALRLNTTYTYSDYETMRTYRAGDTINGGMAWTRPIRIGGLQVQRSFGLRPDLVTLPLPAARGTANASAAIAARTGSFGVASAAFSASYYQSHMGYQSYFAYETRLLGLSISASSQMTFGSYDDLASVTARLQQQTAVTNPFDVS